MNFLNRCILIVEDDDDTAQLYAVLLGRAGYDTTITHSGHEALRKAEAQQFDLILSDIGMPHMNGYELAACLRATTGYAEVPLVSVTGFGLQDDADRSRRAGFNKHLVKPVNPVTLLHTISLLINKDG
ncbi:MAG: response regulator [Chitinophagaceae bacterium]